jgi:hypothetical protein
MSHGNLPVGNPTSRLGETPIISIQMFIYLHVSGVTHLCLQPGPGTFSSIMTTRSIESLGTLICVNRLLRTPIIPTTDADGQSQIQALAGDCTGTCPSETIMAFLR